jgi:hypothetical protein
MSKCYGQASCNLDFSDLGFDDFCLNEINKRWASSSFLKTSD